MPIGTNGIVTRHTIAPSSPAIRPSRVANCGQTIATKPAGTAASSPQRAVSISDPSSAPAERAEVPEHEHRQRPSPRTRWPAGGGPSGRSPSPSTRRAAGGRRPGGERATRRSTRAIVKPYTPLRAREQQRAAQCGGGRAAIGDDADGAVLRGAREHEQRHHAGLEHRAAGGDGGHAEHGAERSDHDAHRGARRRDRAQLGVEPVEHHPGEAR